MTNTIPKGDIKSYDKAQFLNLYHFMQRYSKNYFQTLNFKNNFPFKVLLIKKKHDVIEICFRYQQ